MSALREERGWTEGVSAIVVNHDSGDALLACVASLRAAGLTEIVVVDNASSDGSLARLAAADRDVGLVPTGANLGYGRAINLGAERTTGETLLVCNPDLTLDAGAARELVSLLGATRDVAVVGPTLLGASGERYPSARSFPALGDAIGHALVGLVRPDNPFTRRYQLADERFEGPTDVDWVSGACMAIRRDAFVSVGGFDPGYFMYVEDLDLCWRLRRAGWRVVHLPSAVVTHLGGVSSRRHPLAMLAAHHRSTWRFLRRSARGRERLLLPLAGVALATRFVAAVLLQLRSGRHEGGSRRREQVE